MRGREIINELADGNTRYVTSSPTNHDNAALRNATKDGQTPKAYILSCIDSRVPVETVFDQAIGDLFVGRVAGNVINSDQLGSIEYAVCALEVPLLVVMGHSSCGAVKGACDGVELGNLTSLLEKIQPAIRQVEALAKTEDKLTAIIKANVQNSIAQVREQSPELAAKEKSKHLTIIGAYYDLESGKVEFL